MKKLEITGITLGGQTNEQRTGGRAASDMSCHVSFIL